MRSSPRQIVAKAQIRMNQLLPEKPVRREVQGVSMVLPRSHVLPFYAGPGSKYGRNIVELGQALAQAEGGLCLLDVGANVGDTTLQVLDKAPGKAVCVEPDATWLRYLRLNVGHLNNVEIEPSAIVGSRAEKQLSIVRHAAGTSRLERATGEVGPPTITADELLQRHPQLANVRLVKSDTDGWDVMLMPHLAKAFAGSRPLMFFEFDLRLTALATPEVEPRDLWPTMARLGYKKAVVWDNGGRLLGAEKTADLPARMVELDAPRRQKGYDFWDVALCHADDEVGTSVLDEVSLSFSGSSGRSATG